MWKFLNRTQVILNYFYHSATVNIFWVLPITLIFDLLTNLGNINSLNYNGVNRRRVGPIAAASVERAMNIFTSSSTFGNRDMINGISSSIAVGQLSARAGTGAISVIDDITPITNDRPNIPSVDDVDILTDDLIDYTMFELTQLTDLLVVGIERPLLEFVPSIDKSTFPQPAIIVENMPAIPDVVVPPGMDILMASQTLQTSVLDVLTSGGIDIEPVVSGDSRDVVPKIGDVQPVSTPLSPVRPKSLLDLTSQLKHIPTEVVSPPSMDVTKIRPVETAKKIEPIVPEKPALFTFGRPAASRPFVSGSTPIVPTPQRVEIPVVLQQKPQRLPRSFLAVLTNKPVPQVPSPPAVTRIPRPPRSIVEEPEPPTTPIIRTASPKPVVSGPIVVPSTITLDSILNMLPDVGEEVVSGPIVSKKIDPSSFAQQFQV